MNRSTVWLVIAFWAMHSSATLAMNQTFLDYISRYKDIAIQEMQRTGIPASIKLAQALQESGAGTSELARQANNHFGIKCHNDWVGDTYYREDDDYDEFGRLRKSCFRVYNDAEQSFVEHSEFLKRPRYSDLFQLDPTDYKGWARGLRKAGYATDPAYANRLIDLIERFNLHQYDLMGKVAGDVPTTVSPNPQPNPNPPAAEDGYYLLNDVKYIAALSGESLQDIARRTGTSVNNLMDYNENGIKPTQLLKGGTRVYIQPKRDYYRGRQKYHVVQNGETMFDIAQLYGVKLDKLYERNRMASGTQPAVNEEIKLRGSKVRNTPRLNRDANQRDNSEPEFLFEEPIVAKPAPVRNEPEPDTESNRPTPPPVQENLDEDPFEEQKPVQPTPQPEAIYHVVQEGDTLWNISKRYNITVEILKKLNNLDSNIIKKGMQLRVQ